MLNKHDLCKQLGMSLEEIAYMYAKRILPEPITIGGDRYWREPDIRQFKRYLLKRAKCRARGIDPDSPRGPAPPIYSTVEKPRFDPRAVVAAEREAERQKRSRTLAKGSAAIEAQPQVSMPEAKSTKRVEG